MLLLPQNGFLLSIAHQADLRLRKAVSQAVQHQASPIDKTRCAQSLNAARKLFLASMEDPNSEPGACVAAYSAALKDGFTDAFVAALVEELASLFGKRVLSTHTT